MSAVSVSEQQRVDNGSGWAAAGRGCSSENYPKMTDFLFGRVIHRIRGGQVACCGGAVRKM